MNKLEQIQQRINSLQQDLSAAKVEYNAMRLDLLREVDMVRNDASITLLFKGRVINAKKNRYGRFKVTESKKTLVNEYFGGIHDLRVDVACGTI